MIILAIAPLFTTSYDDYDVDFHGLAALDFGLDTCQGQLGAYTVDRCVHSIPLGMSPQVGAISLLLRVFVFCDVVYCV